MGQIQIEASNLEVGHYLLPTIDYAFVRVTDSDGSLVPTSHLLLGTDFPFGQEIGLHYTLRGIVHYPRFTHDDRTAVLHGNAGRRVSTGVSN